MTSFLRRASGSSGGTAPGGGAAPSVADTTQLPALLEFLSSTQWPDGTARQTGTCLLMVDEGRAKICLSDRDQGLVLFVTVPSLVDGVATAEEALRDAGADWRPSRQSRGRQSAKR
jgi:hypothetical protein